MKLFKQQVILITGAGSGIGKELARQLGSAGAQLVLSDIHVENVSTVAAEIHQAGGQAEAQLLDVTDADAVASHIDEVIVKYKRIDYIFNNAGIAISGEMQDTEVKHWRRIVEINLMGVVHGSLAAYKQMVRQGSGHIVNIASVAGLVPFPMASSYAATKHAVVGLSRSLRYEGEDLGVKVSAVCPAFIESNIYSGERVGVEFGLKESIPFRIIPVDEACAKILKGVIKNKEIIIFPRYAKVMWWLDRHFWAPLRKMHRKSVGVFRHRKQKTQRKKQEV